MVETVNKVNISQDEKIKINFAWSIMSIKSRLWYRWRRSKNTSKKIDPLWKEFQAPRNKAEHQKDPDPSDLSSPSKEGKEDVASQRASKIYKYSDLMYGWPLLFFHFLRFLEVQERRERERESRRGNPSMRQPPLGCMVCKKGVNPLNRGDHYSCTGVRIFSPSYGYKLDSSLNLGLIRVKIK